MPQSSDADPNLMANFVADREVLLWLSEVLIQPRVVMVCRCGHDLSEHDWADVNDEEGGDRPWPCTFPKRHGAPMILCTCRDFAEPELDDALG